MFLFDQRITGLDLNKGKVVAKHIHELHNNFDRFLPLTVYPKFHQDPDNERIRLIEPMFRYTQINNVIKSRETSMEMCAIRFKNNYDEIEHEAVLNHKVYTFNKGYFSPNNLGTQDVLMDETGRICKILHKEFYILHDTSFYTLELKNGNNIVANNLVCLPK